MTPRAEEVSPGGSNSPLEAPVGRAHRACEKCTRTKKKCDKGIPSCSRCARLAAPCCYDYVFTAPTTALVDHSESNGHPLSMKTSFSAPGPVLNILDPDCDISAGIIMNLLTSQSVDWRESVAVYFRTTNLWFSVVHHGRFSSRIEREGGGGGSGSGSGSGAGGDPQVPRDADLALLVVCMHLITQHADSGRPVLVNGTGMLAAPMYLAARRILGVMRANASATAGVELAQCAALLGLYEFGHGDAIRAYVTIGDAYTTAKSLGVRPGKYVEGGESVKISLVEEERRDLYWALLIVDRLIRVERRLMWKPFHVPTPVEDDLLPSTNIIWDPAAGSPVTTTQHHPAGVHPSVTLGAFQRNCQCAILFTRALHAWEGGGQGHNHPFPRSSSFAELDEATRAIIEAMLSQTSSWSEYYECFAICTCLLLLLYCSFLRTVPADQVHPQSADVDVAKAIAGINFTVRIIADTTADLNDQLARRPGMLTPCSSPVTPYGAYHSLSALSNFETVIVDADARFHDVYSSLHFFAKRWGVAGQLVERIESFIAEKDENADHTFMFP